MVNQSRISNPIYGKRIKMTMVPIRPELILAIATGEIAYRKLAITRNQLCEVIFEKSLKLASMKISGAKKKSNVINRFALPNNIVEPRATTANQDGDP